MNLSVFLILNRRGRRRGQRDSRWRRVRLRRLPFMKRSPFVKLLTVRRPPIRVQLKKKVDLM